MLMTLQNLVAAHREQNHKIQQPLKTKNGTGLFGNRATYPKTSNEGMLTKTMLSKPILSQLKNRLKPINAHFTERSKIGTRFCVSLQKPGHILRSPVQVFVR